MGLGAENRRHQELISPLRLDTVNLQTLGTVIYAVTRLRDMET